MKKQNLKFKLITGGMLIVILPLITVGLFSVNKASNALLEAGKSQATQVAQDLTTMTELFLEQTINFAELMANDSLVVDTAEKVYEKGLDGTIDERKALSQIFTANFKRTGSGYDLFFMTDTQGIVMVDSLGGGLLAKKISVAERDYFKAAKSGKEKIIGAPTKSKASGEAVFVVAIPLKTKSGQFAGIVALTVKLSSVSDKLNQVKLGKTGYPYMVNRKGVILAHPKKDFILKLDISGLKGMESITANMLAQKTGVDEYVFKGVQKIAGYAPVPATGWAIGVTQNKSEFMAAAVSIRNIIVLVAGLSLLITIGIVLLFIRGIMAQLGGDPSEIARIARSIAGGDLTVQFSGKDKKITGVYADMKQMTENLSNMFRNISGGVQTLTDSSGDLSTISQQMSSGAEQTSDKSNTVAVAAEEMATNMNCVAAATEQTTTNIQMIASAAEEMIATINEISNNISKGRETTSQAVVTASEVSEKVDDLGQAASEINKVTETIAEISEQTNLLALNATIEAARAGEAGKGFAVVAGEIKELAKQTADATSEISSKIANVQTSTKESVAAIETIVTVIGEINTVVTSVATAIEEQSATTQEISTNVNQAAAGLQEVSQSVNQTSAVAGDVTKNITEVSQATEEINGGSRQVRSSADALLSLAEKLNNMVSEFKI